MPAHKQLQRENEALRRRLEEAEEALRAIRAGEVDAVVVESGREQVFTLESAHNPYRLVVAQVPHAAVTLTVDGSILACNQPFSALLRRPPAELYGRQIRELVAPEHRETLERILHDATAGEVRDALVLLRDDGHRAPMHVSARPLREGAWGLSVLLTDITEELRVEELQRTQRALRESEERLATDLAAAERLQEISTRLIQQGEVGQLYDEILDAAVAIARSDFATLQVHDAEGGRPRSLAHRGFSDEVAEWLARAGTEGGTTSALALRSGSRVVAPDLTKTEGVVGTPALEVYLAAGVRAAQSTPLLSRAGEPLGMISTHWREPHEPSERDLRLLDVLARQAADLIERSLAEQALRDADRKKDQFLATLAHELRNPLAPVRNAVQILKEQAPPVAELKWAEQVIDRQVQQMSRLLDDLLDVSRIAHDKPQLRCERVALASVIEAAIEVSRPLLADARHELSVVLPSEPLLVDADPVRLAQVFANLLNNAAKYTDEGGHIDLTAERQGDEVVVSVRDDGIGIAPELLPHVFELFSQAKPALVRSQGGLGIGLSLVKGLAELHGGTVEARSDGPGRGSEFVVRLPLATGDAPAARREPEGTAERGAAATRRVLVVDDNHDSADSLVMLLEVVGHEAHAAYDGLQCLEVAESLRPEVMLVDIGLPSIDGYEVCRRIRATSWGRDLLMVALTGWGRDEDRRRSLEAGFDDHLVKPVDPRALTGLLESHAS